MALEVVMNTDHDGGVKPIELDIVGQGARALGAATLLDLVQVVLILDGQAGGQGGH